MRITRSPEDLCLICGTEKEKGKADATNSHFTPMGIIKSNTGKRWREETYTVDTDNTIDVYYGRENLKNTDDTIKEDPHAANHIFCNKCEKLLSDVLESQVTDLLNNDLRNPHKKPNFPETKISDEVFHKECVRADSLRVRLFFYSIAWRQCLQQKLIGGKGEILTPDQMEYLRSVIYSGLYEGIENNEKIANCYPITIVTANGFNDPTLHHISPHPNGNYPEVFCANEYLILLYPEGFDGNSVNDDFLGLPPEVFSQEVMNEGSETFKVTFIKDDAFEAFQKATWEKRAKEAHRDKLIDDFKHAFSLRHGYPFPANHQFQLNLEIDSTVAIAIVDLLCTKPKVEFDGMVSEYYTFGELSVSHPQFGNLVHGYCCLLCRKEGENKHGCDIVLAVAPS